MSANLKEVYDVNPSFTLADDDLLYSAKDPYTPGTSTGITKYDLFQQFGRRPTVIVSGTTKTLALPDANTFQRCTNNAAVTITVPPTDGSSSGFVLFPDDTEIEIYWGGGASGQPTLALGTNVIIQSNPGLKIKEQYTGAILKLLDKTTNLYTLIGNLST